MSLSVGNLPSSVDQSQEFQVDVNFSCPNCSDSYLRGVFYPSGTSYFGYTQDNSGNWSNASGSNCTSFFKIAQTDLNQFGSWSGQLKFKLDTQSSYYNGPGEYLFKVGRYTSSCSSPLWSSEVTIAVTGPTPTATPTPTSTPVTTSTPTPTSKPTATVTPKPTSSLMLSVTKIASPSQEEVLGQSSQEALKFQFCRTKRQKQKYFLQAIIN